MKPRTAILASLSILSLLALPALLAAQDKLADDAELVETRTEVPKIKAAGEFQPKDGVVLIEISEYAGYAGLIAANGGLDANPDSLLAKKAGMKVKLAISEEESWSALNSGRLAGATSTVDVMAVYGRQLQVVVPVLMGFSRGSDGIVVRSDIKRINDLAGKVLATAQFTEADFFARYLAQEAGLAVNMLASLKDKPDPAKVNLVYTGDGFGAGDLFLRDIKAGRNRLAGCITWSPKTTEVAEASGGKAKVLVTNRNLLIVADVLMLNKGFAAANPKVVAGLVEGLLEGNRLVRSGLDAQLPVIAKAFKWDAAKARAEMTKVHLANLPENLAFFSGNMDAAGSFSYIYETAGYVYGSELLGRQADGEKLLDLSHLRAIDKAGTYKDQKVAIVPIDAKGGVVEKSVDMDQSLLSKDIRFYFVPNSSKLDMTSKENAKGLESISQLLRVAPGSRVLLRGHADGSLLAKFQQEGGAAKVREVKLTLKNLSKARCGEVRQIVQDKFSIDSARLESQGVGADEPTGKGPDADRRVEVQWFMVE